MQTKCAQVACIGQIFNETYAACPVAQSQHVMVPSSTPACTCIADTSCSQNLYSSRLLVACTTDTEDDLHLQVPCSQQNAGSSLGCSLLEHQALTALWWLLRLLVFALSHPTAVNMLLRELAYSTCRWALYTLKVRRGALLVC